MITTFEATLIFLIFVAFMLGRLKGYNEGRRDADEVIESREREIEEMMRTGKVAIDVEYYPVADIVPLQRHEKVKV